MTRKHYIALAAALKSAKETSIAAHASEAARLGAIAGVRQAARDVAAVLAHDNPRFDRERFLTAAGVQS